MVYMDNAERFLKSELPDIEKFHSTLTDEGISQDDYDHAKNVWRTYDLKSLREYHDLYLKSDVTLLCDVFETFREMSLETYKLDPVHFYTAPGLSWEACLKCTGVHLELLANSDQLLFFEKGIRGGVSTISHRSATANNRYLPDTYDPDKAESYIMYLDANNLYGWAMSEPLPTGNFQFVKASELTNFYDIGGIDCAGETGYILEVDLDYPDHRHDDHNDYPLAPEQLIVTEDMLSSRARQLRESLCKGGMGHARKLTPNLQSKRNYVTYGRNLQMYVKLGLRIAKVHRVMSFTQSPWLAKYIDLNTRLRKVAKNAFEKDFFKLMNNSVFGKTIEQLRKRMDVRVTTRVISAERLIAKPNFETFVQVNEDVAVVKLRKLDLLWNKPTYVGFCVLEISKLLMYDFHYGTIRETYGSRARLLFTDTDSLCYHIETPDVYDDMLKSADLYDTSDYPTEHRLYSSQNAKTIGKFKDECAGKPPIAFVGLCSKMYSILTSPEEHKFAAKGVKASYAKKVYRHQRFVDCLKTDTVVPATFKKIGSAAHCLRTEEVSKVGLSPYDDKRYLLDDKYSTLAYGHCRIRSMR